MEKLDIEVVVDALMNASTVLLDYAEICEDHNIKAYDAREALSKLWSALVIMNKQRTISHATDPDATTTS